MNQASPTTNSGPGYASHSDHKIELLPAARRVRVEFGGETVADSTNARLIRENTYPLVYYFPRDDVRMEVLSATEHTSYCPFKGEASYWSVGVGDRSVENAVWGYPTPYDEVSELKDFVSFYWDKMDAWYEDEKRVIKPSSL